MDSLTGSILEGRYEVLGEVGRGQYGVVYKAKHKVLDRPVAVKVLHEEVKNTDTSFLRFKREAETTSQITHPNVVKIFDFGISQEKFPFVVMDLVQGPLLSELIEERGRLSFAESLPIFSQICEGIQSAHDLKILHRDLRPENIFLTRRAGPEAAPVVQIVDFGIAKRLNEDRRSRLTAEGEVLGTPAYMSPEQVLGQQLDHRSDIYAMGCLMFKTLTGKLPFLGRTAPETMAMQAREEAPNFADVVPGLHLPIGLQFAVKKALAKDPQNRHQSMTELREVLEAV